MKSIFWIWPDRGTKYEAVRDEEVYWGGYRKAAEAVGMHMDVTSPEGIDVVYRPGSQPVVWVKGRRADPAETIFVTKFYTYPHQMQDAWLLASTFWTLKEAGFYLPVPPDLSIPMNDKMATYLHFQQTDLKMIPSIRLTTGRELPERNLDVLLEGFDFPMIMKPISWSSGMGLVIVRNRTELNSVLRLASASNMTVVLQPCLDVAAIVDYRVYCVDARPHTSITRVARQGEVVANLGLGGSSQVVETPPEILAPARFIASMIGLPYCCIDFLFDGSDYWFSEIELDGSISARLLVHDAMRLVLEDRFRAYDRAHEQWLQQTSHRRA